MVILSRGIYPLNSILKETSGDKRDGGAVSGEGKGMKGRRDFFITDGSWHQLGFSLFSTGIDWRSFPV
ncbi:MAG: hypothetical protein ABIK97_06240 [candidate division WOR-3 bacterium]